MLVAVRVHGLQPAFQLSYQHLNEQGESSELGRGLVLFVQQQAQLGLKCKQRLLILRVLQKARAGVVAVARALVAAGVVIVVVTVALAIACAVGLVVILRLLRVAGRGCCRGGEGGRRGRSGRLLRLAAVAIGRNVSGRLLQHGHANCRLDINLLKVVDSQLPADAVALGWICQGMRVAVKDRVDVVGGLIKRVVRPRPPTSTCCLPLRQIRLQLGFELGFVMVLNSGLSKAAMN